MKYLLISVICLLTVCAAVVGDCILINRLCERFEEKVNSFSASEADFTSFENLKKIEEAVALWESNALLLDISLNQDLFEVTKDNLISAQEYCEKGSFSDYCVSKELFRDGIEKIKETATPSAVNIF